MKDLNYTIHVSGMSCPGCAGKVSGYLASQNIACDIDFASGQLRIKSGDVEKVSSLVKSLGYSVNDPKSEDHDHSHDRSRLTVLIAVALTAPLVLGHVLGLHAFHNPWLQLGLSTPVYLIGAFHFGRSAWIGLKSGVAHMDLLVILGATAAYIYSLIGLIFNLGDSYLFFESAASIITFVMVGGLVEQLAVKRTTSALQALKDLRPTRVKLLNDQGRIDEVAIDALSVGHEVALGIGDSVPCDGEVSAGIGEVDESTLTGEPVPVTKFGGSRVFAGTTVVSGSFSVRVSSIGSQTVLGQIIETVASAQFGKPRIQRLGDRVSAVFVPAVIVLAIFAFIGNIYFGVSASDALLRAIAVVVIACPCAMGLATPVAIMVCLGELAKKGVLIKSGDIIEALAEVKFAFLDKTGTLTKGIVDATLTQSSIPESELGSIIVALEQNSSHPIARALTKKFADSAPLALEQIEEKPGVGVFGKDGATTFDIQRIISSTGCDIGVFKDGVQVAAFKLNDTLRPESITAVAKLKEQGISVYILSGDNESRCQAMAAQLGIPAHSNLLPEMKLEKIKQISAGQLSIFVGDGINDVLGLAGAGIGISFSQASDIAVKTAPVVITRADLMMIPGIMMYSRTVLRTIKQNLFWAFFYNIAAIPVAAFGLLTPTFAAIVMGLSDVVVVGNSLRLRGRRF